MDFQNIDCESYRLLRDLTPISDHPKYLSISEPCPEKSKNVIPQGSVSISIFVDKMGQLCNKPASGMDQIFCDKCFRRRLGLKTTKLFPNRISLLTSSFWSFSYQMDFSRSKMKIIPQRDSFGYFKNFH